MHERCAGGMSEFKAEAGMHQGSGLSPFLLTEESDRLTDEVRQESPRTMMFVDDIVVCKESREVCPWKERDAGWSGQDGITCE